MPTVITRTYYLELNGVPLATPAWECPDLSPLLDDPALKGEDSDRPYVSGSVPHLRRPTATIYTLPLNIFGDRDHEGAEHEDVVEGLVTNRFYLRHNLGLADPDGDGTVTVTLHLGDVLTLTGPGHFLGFKGSRTEGIPPELIRTTFDLSIPDGLLEETGS